MPGTQEFNEKGIQKLGELAGEELLDTARHIEALQAADRSYALFEAAASEDGTAKPIPAAPDTDEEDASGNQKEYKQSVRFIVETEEIKADSPHSHSDIDISARS